MKRTCKPQPRRRPRGSLSRLQVVEAALALADREGLDALTMPRLARELNSGVMTIYGYVQDKGDLLDAVAQRGIADIALPRPLPAHAADVLVAWGRALRLTLLAHPSLPVIFLTRAVIGPGIFRGVEVLLGALARAGMPPPAGVHAIYAVLTYATGFVAWELPRTHGERAAAYAAAWRREYAGLPVEDYPLTASAVDELPRVAGEEQFEFGLAGLAQGLLYASHGPRPAIRRVPLSHVHRHRRRE